MRVIKGYLPCRLTSPAESTLSTPDPDRSPLPPPPLTKAGDVTEHMLARFG